MKKIMYKVISDLQLWTKYRIRIGENLKKNEIGFKIYVYFSSNSVLNVASYSKTVN